MSKRMWQRTVAALFAGGTVVGGWLGLALAQPVPNANIENAVWTRAAPTVAAPVVERVVPVAAAAPPLPTPTAPPPIARPAEVVPVSEIVAPVFKAAPAPSIPPAVDPAPRPFKPPVDPPAPTAQPAKSAPPAKPLPLATPDFNLRPDNAGNSVNPYGATSRPKGMGPQPPTDKYVFPLPMPGAAPAAPDLPAIPAAPTTIVLPTAPASIDPLTTIPTPGADPMTAKQTTMAALLGGALAVLPTHPAAALPMPPRPLTALAVPTVPVAADPVKGSVEERLTSIEKQLALITELLQGRKDSQGFYIPSDPGLLKSVKDLGDDVKRLKPAIEGGKKSTSLRPVAPAPAPAKNTFTAGKGIVRIQNGYPVEITIAINSVTYRVAPNTQQDVFVPVGDFTYQLLNSGANPTPVKGPIGEQELVKLRIK